MTYEERIDEYIEWDENPHRIIISTEEFGLLKQAFLFIERHFGERARVIVGDDEYLSLTIWNGRDDECTVRAWLGGRIWISITRDPFMSFSSCFEYAFMFIDIHQGGTLEIRMELPGLDSLRYRLDFPKEEFGKMLQEFHEEFGEGRNE